MIDKEWLSAAMQDRYEEEYDEECTCGHGPRGHREVPRQWRRPSTVPCDDCNCLDYYEEAKATWPTK